MAADRERRTRVINRAPGRWSRQSSAAARNIYLEEPHGPDGFWTQLPSLNVKSLFVWGQNDGFVPAKFADHVRDAVPSAHHVVLDCGHVPQLERPRQTHAAIEQFLADGRLED